MTSNQSFPILASPLKPLNQLETIKHKKPTLVYSRRPQPNLDQELLPISNPVLGNENLKLGYSNYQNPTDLEWPIALWKGTRKCI